MWIVLTILGIYLLILIVVTWISLHPIRIPQFISPGLIGLPQQDVEFETEDGLKLRGWWVPGTGEKGVIVFAHGYLMNRCEFVPVAIRMNQLGYSCLLFDLRAHGRSQGKKCGLGWLERYDAKAAVLFARTKMPHSKVVYIGSSMGSAAGAFAAAELSGLVDAIVIDSAYSKLQGAILGWWNFLGGKWLRALFAPMTWIGIPFIGFNPFKVDVARAVSQITEPILFIHGEADTLATAEDARRNIKHARDPKEELWFPGRNHAEFRWEEPEKYLSELESWLNRAFSQ
ncbi:MAG TPA: alpha/beta fold hydrolase [Fimbriimonadaceae bacterium]|nr:alpha/beta fold hydrolase [Fimbriimonadaceae bacterium]